MKLTNKINILLVDDSPDKLFALSCVLEELGQNLVQASSGKEALRRLLEQDFAVILLDVNMPGMDGFETAQLIRQRPSSEYTPIIFITGINTSETHVHRGYELGAVDYIFTPVVPEVLRGKVSVFAELHKKQEEVKRSQQLLAAAQQIAHLGSWEWDIASGCIQCSEELSRIYGLPPDQFEGTYGAFLKRLHPGDRRQIRSLIDATLRSGRHSEFDCRIRRPDGEMRTLYCRGEVLRNGSGEPVRVVGISQDITERKIAEEALRASEEKFRCVAETAFSGILTSEEDGAIIYLNKSVERIFGCRKEDLMGQPLTSLMPREFKNFQELIHRTGLSGKTLVVRGRRKNGKSLPIELSLASWQSHGRTLYTALIRDVSQREAADRRIQRYTHALEDAQNRMLQVMEKLRAEVRERQAAEEKILEISGREQARLGQELHDGLGQTLTGISFMIRALSKKLESQNLPEEADSASRVSSLVSEAIGRTRNLARGFYPVELEANGLIGALQDLAAREESLFGIVCQFKTEGGIDVPDLNKATQVYRIAQEAIENAIKHGKARNVMVELFKSGEHICLTVQDDGQGFPAQLPRKRGMGLQIMKYRAGMLHGTFEITPQSFGGTKVTCVFPNRTIEKNEKIQNDPEKKRISGQKNRPASHHRGRSSGHAGRPGSADQPGRGFGHLRPV